jgi:hypothetical protein
VRGGSYCVAVQQKRMRMPGFEPGISPPQGEVLTTILHTPGEAGYRSQYLSHAKRALYHLSYIPIQNYTHHQPNKFALSWHQKYAHTTNKNTKHATHHTTKRQQVTYMKLRDNLYTTQLTNPHDTTIHHTTPKLATRLRGQHDLIRQPAFALEINSMRSYSCTR